ncbi:MAG: asparagine synthase (glutamine-hydrolyzing) [Deltaproteobacteria bacterium]|nr:asparagine synthase (glutamine-hydrolyzing) [Deltaproteobacteria bacterium]
MCGIAGYIKVGGESREYFQRLSHKFKNVLKHRGPDSEGEYIDEVEGVLLSHTRLSIIDLSSASSQPFFSDDKQIVLIYNGEIYNFLDIRAELEKEGVLFRSSGDTETIVRAYQRWGENAFSKFIGMFAFALYDTNRSLLYLVRDPIGIKPLYYTYQNRELMFASEVRIFSDYNENYDWRIYFLTFGYLPNPITTKANVLSLEKGNYLKFDVKNGKMEIRKFVTNKRELPNIDQQEAIKVVREYFYRSINRHLISDAPLGIFLSGGIDSSLIALIASELRKEKITTLSVQFKEAEYSEERYQNEVAELINSNHWAHLFTEKDFYDSFDDIVNAMDQPTIDGVNTYFVSKMAKEAGCKTVLSGLGGDELFMGYASFGIVEKLSKIRSMGMPIRRVIQSIGWAFENEKYRKLSLLGYNNPIFFYLLFRSLFIPSDVNRILGVKKSDIIEKIENLYLNKTEYKDLRNWLSNMESDFYLLGQLLKDTDFMSMWHSVETRVPFLDNELVNIVSMLPSKFKWRKSQPKYLITEAFNDKLPKDIIFRKKQGFTFPFDVWIRDRLDFFRDLAYKEKCEDFVDMVFKRFREGKINFSRIWALVVMNVKKW